MERECHLRTGGKPRSYQKLEENSGPSDTLIPHSLPPELWLTFLNHLVCGILLQQLQQTNAANLAWTWLGEQHWTKSAIHGIPHSNSKDKLLRLFNTSCHSHAKNLSGSVSLNLVKSEHLPLVTRKHPVEARPKPDSPAWPHMHILLPSLSAAITSFCFWIFSPQEIYLLPECSSSTSVHA